MNPQRVIYVMCAILRDQATLSWMPREVVSYIFEKGLLRTAWWPAFVISLTMKGEDYLVEHET